MTTTNLGDTAQALVDNGKGILAADETVATVTKRLAALTIDSTPDSRRDYREMFLTTSGIADFISGVILQDETIHQRSSKGTLLVAVLAAQGILPGIKVDSGAKPLAGAPRERITEGLDRLRDRLRDYHEIGARFAKWRAVIAIDDGLPSAMCVRANAVALARYASLCQEQGLVPIVEPEVLMNGVHTIERCEEITGYVLHAVFDALFEHNVSLEGMLLKPNMVISGDECGRQASVHEVALATLRCLRRHVPVAVPGIVFLSGGQDHLRATMHLSEINELDGTKPWKLSFSFGRALQDEALKAWRGKPTNVSAAQRAFYHRAKCDSAAALGRYTPTMEKEAALV
jgi:fructose-bisphosphate aldolase, class I